MVSGPIRYIVVQNEAQTGAETFNLRPGHGIFGLIDYDYLCQERVHLSAAFENVGSYPIGAFVTYSIICRGSVSKINQQK